MQYRLVLQMIENFMSCCNLEHMLHRVFIVFFFYMPYMFLNDKAFVLARPCSSNGGGCFGEICRSRRRGRPCLRWKGQIEEILLV